MATTREGETLGPRDFVPDLESRRRMALQADISGARNDLSMRNMVALLHIMIDDTRKENDRAMVRSILRNQGKIAAFQDLLDIIGKDYPA
jgi:hypothetical protein